MKAEPWLVVMTKPRMETDAVWNLNNQNFEAYSPRWIDRKRRASGWQRVESPMFPRYAFVRPTRSRQDIMPIRSTIGVMSVVKFGLQAARVADTVIQEIRMLEERRMGSNTVPFKKGDCVSVLEGPFAGISAEVFAIAEERVVVLFDLIHQQHKITVDSNHLVAN